MKLIYVFERRHAYIYDDKMFGIEHFRDKGFEIEIWSLVNWTFDNQEFPENGSNASNVFYINSEDDMESNLQRLKKEECYFIFYPYHAYGITSYQARRCIKKYGYRFSNLSQSPSFANLKIQSDIKSPIWTEIKSFIKLLVLFVLVYIFRDKSRKKEFLEKVVAKLGWILMKSDHNFVTTEIMYYMFPNMLEKYSKRNILLHSESYEEFLDLRNEELQDIPREYAVYIDQFLPGHSDFKKHGRNPIIQNKNQYYYELNNLFDKIEEKFKYNVIIAAHPKAEYKNDEFKGRQVVFFQTNNLVKHAKLVIFQYSTAFGLACLFEKDYLNIYSGEMFDNNPAVKEIYSIIGANCGAKGLNISDKGEMQKWYEHVHRYNSESVAKYKRLMLVSEKSKNQNESMFKMIAEIIAER